MYRYSGDYVQVQRYQYRWYRGSTTVGKYQYTPHQTNSTQFVNSTVHNIEIRLYTIYELNGTQYRNSTVHNLRTILYTSLYFTVHNSCLLEYTICVSALKTHKFWRGGPREFMRYTNPVFIPRINRYRLGTI